MDDNGRVFIKYTNGKLCDEDPTRNVSSVITFFCRKGEEKVSTLSGDIKPQLILLASSLCSTTFDSLDRLFPCICSFYLQKYQ